MQQIRLKSVIQKLGILSFYLLFLSVQLNLKYTFTDIVFPDYSSCTYSNGGKAGTNTSSVEESQPGKPVVQKLRLNKRYVPEDVFLIYSSIHEPVNTFSKKVEKTFIPAPQVSDRSVCHALLRGPPASIALAC